jgi:hypothetical protein
MRHDRPDWFERPTRRWFRWHEGDLVILVCVAAIILALLFLPARAQARTAFRGAPLPYSCDTVRTAVKAFTQQQLMRLARKFNVTVTPSQRREAQKCLVRQDGSKEGI